MKTFPLSKLDVVKRLTSTMSAILDATRIDAEFRSHNEHKDEIYAHYTSWGEDYYINLVVVKKAKDQLLPQRKVENIKATGEVI